MKAKEKLEIDGKLKGETGFKVFSEFNGTDGTDETDRCCYSYGTVAYHYLDNCNLIHESI